MDTIIQAIEDWFREILTEGITTNLTGLFDQVNEKVGEIAGQVGSTPQNWNTAIFNMVHNLSENVMVPIAGVILAIVMTLELIQMIVERNNFHNDVDTFQFFKWAFKTAGAVLIVTNTWDIVMAVFDLGHEVIVESAGVVIGDTSIDMTDFITDLEGKLEAMSIGALIGLWMQSGIVKICMGILQICILVVVFGRMIEIYLVTSVAPIPMATMMNKESGQMGQNYLRNLFALAFQAFLIIVCVAIYAALVENITVTDDISYAIWTCMGYTVLLCFSLFKTGSLAKSIFNAH
ncbi:MAG: CD0415/CD1112 family protein [Acutalibacteraceae bacterium]|nr:CD0415/CD1112 family protein [Acutalibacteraceae bacterium]